MSSHSIPTGPATLHTHATNDRLLLPRHVRALVVSSQLESRQPLVRTLEAIPADVIACSNRLQAEEVLSQQAFEIVFRDEHLPDGSYADLLVSSTRSAGFQEWS